MNYLALGRQIRKYRQLANWTQEDLAERAGISASFLGHIERGSRKASLETLICIANALNVSTDHLLGDSLEKELSDISDINLLDPGKRYLLQEVMRAVRDNADKWD